MKTRLDHLPARKRADLERIVELARVHVPTAGLVILFGSYARGDWKEAPLRGDQHASDYDILVIPVDPAVVTDGDRHVLLERACLAADLTTHARVIVETYDYVSARLAEDYFFYRDIYNEGVILYDADVLRLSPPGNPGPEERRRLSRRYFDHWFERARNFYDYYNFAMQKNDAKGAAFLLHQAAETAIKTVLLVRTYDFPKEHYLSVILPDAARTWPPLGTLFPVDTEAHAQAFERLDAAYIGARYHPEYHITREELEYLGGQVETLLTMAEAACREAMAP